MTSLSPDQKIMIDAAAQRAAEAVIKRLPSEAETRRIAQEVAEETVRNIFAKLGLDPDNPKETMELLVFAREAKETTATIKKQAIVSVIAILISGLAFAGWAAIRGSLK